MYKLGVATLRNSGAITCALRLDVEHSETQSASPRINQSLPGFEILIQEIIVPSFFLGTWLLLY